MKETRKYVLQSLSELNRITLPGNKDNDNNGVIRQMDRSEFVSFLSTLLRIDPASRITPQQALQKPFITMYHLAAHSNSPMYVCLFTVTMVIMFTFHSVQEGIQLMSACKQPWQQATPLSHWTSYNMVSVV